jgi:hypothetical protein
MGSRERRRAERQKRKRRSAQRAAEVAPAGEASEPVTPVGADVEPTGTEEPFQERLSRRAEERNAEARARLEPLGEGERPTVVAVGALISALIALIFSASAVVAAIGSVEIEGSEPQPFPLAAFSVMLWMMALGMWRARYWAVLGFQMLLVLLILSVSAGLVAAEELSVLQLIGSLLLLAGLGTLFYFMIRALARIQMPERPGER